MLKIRAKVTIQLSYTAIVNLEISNDTIEMIEKDNNGIFPNDFNEHAIQAYSLINKEHIEDISSDVYIPLEITNRVNLSYKEDSFKINNIEFLK